MLLTEMSLERDVQQHKGDAAVLECLYREALEEGRESDFKEAVSRVLAEPGDEELLVAWAYRLRFLPLPEPGAGVEARPEAADGSLMAGAEARRWLTAILISVILGVVYVLLRRGFEVPPFPVPGLSNRLFWIGWVPCTTWAILAYLALADGCRQRVRVYGAAGLVVGLLCVPVAWVASGQGGTVEGLLAIHLPFAAWLAIGIAVAWAYPDRARQFYGCVVKSLETAVTAGLFLIAGGMFFGLTVGIFSVLGVEFTQRFWMAVASWGIGAIPVLAVATAHEPRRAPAEQSGPLGLSRLLKILTRLILPLAVFVLAVYVAWFIPFNFSRAFESRETLIVYNATIIAVIALIIGAGPGGHEQLAARSSAVLKYVTLVVAGLTAALNVYALAAIAYRTIQEGLTANRQTVIGWNVITLALLALVFVRMLKAKRDTWPEVFGVSIAWGMVPAGLWALWVLVGLPHT